MRFFIWNLDSGLLSKLKNYCHLLNLQSARDEKGTNGSIQKQIALLQQYTNQAWLLCMHCLDL